MKSIITRLALTAALAATAGSTTALAAAGYSESASARWVSDVMASKGEPTANQLAPYGYPASSAPSRVVNLGSERASLNVTQLETVQINVGGKSITWTFDTLGRTPFPLSKVVPGADAITVYVARNPLYVGGGR